jgi:predicted secreted protein
LRGGFYLPRIPENSPLGVVARAAGQRVQVASPEAEQDREQKAEDIFMALGSASFGSAHFKQNLCLCLLSLIG